MDTAILGTVRGENAPKVAELSDVGPLQCSTEGYLL